MNLVRFAIDRPIAVIAAVLMVVLFGLVALQTIPIQLTPDVRKPIITVQTLWPGAAPAEVEREIVNRQEEMLKGVEGLEEIESRSENGRAQVTLTFAIGTNMDRALLLVANRLDRVSGYPEEADRPTLQTAGAEDNAIAWFAIQTVKGNSRPIHTYGDFVEEVIQDRLERVEGVSRTDAFGGVQRELHITVQPERMAQFGLTVTEITQKLRAANASVSAGDVEEGTRRYLVRAEGELDTPEAVRAVVLRPAADSTTGRIGRVTVGDIAEVSYGYSEPRARIRRLGKSALVMNAKREAG
ncbi:MAG: efflux RND transporter permease subunit, partial [Alphaproteobacteria bacterium]|nr:efflux RND transporter permease subunit [Alphaproteobacteria bacterium]